MKLFELAYSLVQNEIIIAKVSARLSRREINNVNLNERLHYFSEKKARIFLEAIGLEIATEKKRVLKGSLGFENLLKAGVEGNRETSYKINGIYQTKKAISVAKRKGLIVPYEKSKRGKYVLIHFPFYNGTMMLKTYKKYDDVYWWCGEYRDLKVYACGNRKNIIDDATDIGEPLWDPSATSSSAEFFDEINNYVSEMDDNCTKFKEQKLFETLSCNLHKGTMRGYKDKTYQGWYVMLLRCDEIRKKNGCTEIFGSPVFVSYDTLAGYGWYYAYNEKDKEIYIENCHNRQGHCLMVQKHSNPKLTDIVCIRNKEYIGYNYGYELFEENNQSSIRIIKNITLVSDKDSKPIKDKVMDDNVLDKIEGVRAIGLTTRVLYKSIQIRKI